MRRALSEQTSTVLASSLRCCSVPLVACMQRLSSQSSWRSLFRNRLKHTQSALPFEFLSEITRPRHEASIKQSSSSSTKNRPLPNLEDLLALRPRLKRQRRRTDSEWAQEYARKFQAGIGSLERAFTLPQLEHLAEQLELQVQGRHTSYRKRDIATQLVRSDQGWGWHDPQVLLDKIKRKSNAPLHKLGTSVLVERVGDGSTTC